MAHSKALPAQTNVDFVLFYCDKDQKEAQKFKERVEKEAAGVTGYMYNQLNPENMDPAEIEEICTLGVQTWFFITDNFIADLNMLFLKDELLVKSVIHGNKCFVPIWAKPKQDFPELPFGLVAFYGLDVSDERLIERIVKMFSCPKHNEAKQAPVSQ